MVEKVQAGEGRRGEGGGGKEGGGEGGKERGEGGKEGEGSLLLIQSSVNQHCNRQRATRMLSSVVLSNAETIFMYDGTSDWSPSLKHCFHTQTERDTEGVGGGGVVRG